VIFGRKLLKYTNSASDADRLTGAAGVVASITSTPLDKVPDVGKAYLSGPGQGTCEGRATCGLPRPRGWVRPLQRQSKQRRPSHSASSRPRLYQKSPRRVHPPEGFSLCAECGEAVRCEPGETLAALPGQDALQTMHGGAVMASKTIARTLQIHGDFIKEIYGAVGDQPFAARRLATLRGRYPSGRLPEPVPQRGYIYSRWQERRSKSHLATLARRPGILCDTGGDGVILMFRDARGGPGTARALDSAA